ncbi:MAG: hypothetical protein D6751_12985 [Deltaproteobacteria bacterium]|nr:MAG: hypothetical protein D6751_12985 [Deltaproteobacteria bacterium]
MRTADKPNCIDREPKNLSGLHAIDSYHLVAMMMCEYHDFVWSQAQTYRAADAVCVVGGVPKRLAEARGEATPEPISRRRGLSRLSTRFYREQNLRLRGQKRRRDTLVAKKRS